MAVVNHEVWQEMRASSAARSPLLKRRCGAFASRVRRVDPVPAPVVPEAGKANETTQQTKLLTNYSKPARQVLRTLWRFQHEQFKEDFSRRWAFGIHPSAMDFPKFFAAYRELTFDGLISMGPRGMVFLTDKGVEFCKQNNSDLTENGDVWDSFVPA